MRSHRLRRRAERSVDRPAQVLRAIFTASTGVAAVCVLVACAPPTLVGREGGPTLPAIVTTSTTTSTRPPETTLPEYYQVQRGDTLTEIAAAYGLPVVAILELNGMDNPDQLTAGQILELPSRDIVATELPPTVAGQTAPTLPGQAATSPPGATAPPTGPPTGTTQTTAP